MYTIGGILYHHGILGQKWGKRNGPPYPLSEGAHSSSEKKAGYKKSIGGGRNEELYEKRKKPSLNKQGNFSLDDYDEEERAEMEELMDDEGFREAFDVTDEYYNEWKNKKLNSQGRAADSKTGFKLKKKETTPQKDLKAVNPNYREDDLATNNNCVLCTATFEMRRRGYDVTANTSEKMLQGFKVYNEMFPGNKQETLKTKSSDFLVKPPKPTDLELDMGKYKKYQEASKKAMYGENREHAKEVMSKLQKMPDSRGGLALTWGSGGGHMVSYEVKKGKVTVYDAQIGKEIKGKALEDLLACTTICSYARLDNVDFDPKKIKGACK